MISVDAITCRLLIQHVTCDAVGPTKGVLILVDLRCVDCGYSLAVSARGATGKEGLVLLHVVTSVAAVPRTERC